LIRYSPFRVAVALSRPNTTTFAVVICVGHMIDVKPIAAATLVAVLRAIGDDAAANRAIQL
jgi:hypothetical protein